jgi:hypothetical protein
VQPSNVTTWDDYTARQAARETVEDLGGRLAESIKQARGRKRRATAAAKESTLATYSCRRFKQCTPARATFRQRSSPASKGSSRSCTLLCGGPSDHDIARDGRVDDGNSGEWAG